MGLYIRVFTGFYTHRKTLRLRAAIGNDAFWVVPRLWAYAADNHPDGQFIDYTAEEIAAVIGYEGDASSMLQAMLKAGFMEDEPLRIKSWEEHNGYHKSYSDRAKAAATARWNKKREQSLSTDKKGYDKKGDKHCSKHAPSIACSITTFPEALNTDSFKKAWNDYLDHRRQSKMKKLTEMGVNKQLKSLAEYGEAEAIAAIERSIANGYQGIFPNENSSTNPRNGQNKRVVGTFDNGTNHEELFERGAQDALAGKMDAFEV